MELHSNVLTGTVQDVNVNKKQLHHTGHSVDPQAFILSIVCPHSVSSFADSLLLLNKWV